MPTTTSVIAAVRARLASAVMALPHPLLRRVAGPPVVLRGQMLDVEMQTLLRLQAIEGAGVETFPFPVARRRFDAAAVIGGGRQPIGSTTDRSIDGPSGPVRLRFYAPRGLTGDTPAIVFVHGGGWLYGGLESHDALCRVLAESAQVRVVALDYRLAPEHPFPAAFEDSWAAWSWVVEHATSLGIDPARIAVGGDSAGGSIAAAIAQHAVHQGTPEQRPAFQLLLYPSTDFTEARPSRAEFGEGFYLTSAFTTLVDQSLFADDADRTDVRTSPILGDVTGVAPAAVVVAGFDPLRDEGEAYAQRMTAAGVPVDFWVEPGLIHGFANMVGLGHSAPRAVARVSAALDRGLDRGLGREPGRGSA